MANDCRNIEPLLAAYALDSLEGEERAQVDAHLPACPDCRARLAEYRAVADGLLMAVPAAAPPARLRQGLVDRIGKSTDPKSAPAERRARRSSPWSFAFGLGLAAMLLVNLVLLQQVIGLRQDQARLQQELGTGQIAQAIAAYPAAQSVLIEGKDAYGTLVYDPDRPVAAMYTWGLQPLPSGQTYQVWLRTTSGDRVSGGTFDSSGSKAFTLVVIRAPDPLQTYSGFGVTIEPEGGSPAPSGPNVLGGSF
jgi:anti-sigma-K factor RskA